MDSCGKTAPHLIEIIPAVPAQAPILANLLELYIHDFSQLISLDLDADGRFGYPHLDLYWKEPERHPFLIKVDGNWAGFVLVCKGSRISADENVWDMAEFFIVRGLRRRGFGLKAAHEIWRMFPGQWEVRVSKPNQTAMQFWKRAIEKFVGRSIDSTEFSNYERAWDVFSFDAEAIT